MAHHDPPQVFLIDGYALIYRAFFAMISRPLRTSKGENTSVAWGVANFLLRLRKDYHPDYLVWVNDAGDSFRGEAFPDYKSTREKLDEELQQDFTQSLTRVDALLEAFRVPRVAVEGYEADDVIGTLAAQAAAEGLQAVIVSGDKDFYQLIGPRVSLLNPGRGGPAGVSEQWVDESNAEERLGVPPTRVIDYLALVGDSSDNVPGVKGIGDKGARELLAQFGDLDTILARAETVTKKRPREALLAQGDNARLSRRLVTIQRDVPVAWEPDAFAVADPDLAAVTSLLAELEFYSLAESLGVTAPLDQTAVEEDALSVTIVSDPAALPALVERLRRADHVVLTVQGSDPDPRRAELVGLALAAAPNEVWYLPFGHRSAVGELAAPEPVANLPGLAEEPLRPLADYLRDPDARKVGHEIKHGWQTLRAAGLELAGVVADITLESFVLDPGRRSHVLDTLALDQLGRPVPRWQDLVGKGKAVVPFAEVDVARAAEYAGIRAAAILALHRLFVPEIGRLELDRLLREIEVPLIPVLVDMEWAGIAIDAALFAELARTFGAESERARVAIFEAAGEEFNVNSPKQLATILFDKGGLPILKKTKTGPSTDADVLEQLSAMGYEVPQRILAYRELQKLLSTYVDVLPRMVNRHTGRIHTTYHQTGAATGRLSSSDPNLQNIPVRTARGGEIRRAFVPATGWRLIVADYSQIELRLLAHLSGDPLLLDAFHRGGDVHRQTAALIFGVEPDAVTPDMRARAKTINFATIYGQGPFALSKQLGVPQAEAKEFIQHYFERFAGVRAYLDGLVESARQQGYVETLFGRRRYIPEVKDKNFNVRSFGERTAQNTPLQGSAADLIKLAMRDTHARLRDRGLKAHLLLQVHDELVLESPPGEVEDVSAVVQGAMEGAAELAVPLVAEVGVGDNWLDAKS